jgi:hypothetical protein
VLEDKDSNQASQQEENSSNQNNPKGSQTKVKKSQDEVGR